MCWVNGNLVSVNVLVDQNRNLWNSLTAFKNCVRKYKENTDSIFVGEITFRDSLIYNIFKISKSL